MVIQIEHLTKQYGNQTVINDLSLNIQEGEFVAIMGASGSGKSTLLHLIGGLESMTQGEIWLHKQALSSLSDDKLAQIRRRNIGFIFQLYNLISALSAVENVAMPLILDKVKRADALQRAALVLEQVGLQDFLKHKPAELSGGQQQRVAIARALVIEPSLILADEPTGALDSRTGDDVMALLRATAKQSRTLLLVTHDPRIASQTDRIISLRDGQIVDDNRLKREKVQAALVRQ